MNCLEIYMLVAYIIGAVGTYSRAVDVIKQVTNERARVEYTVIAIIVFLASPLTAIVYTAEWIRK